jgi:uncharacterized protein YpmS
MSETTKIIVAVAFTILILAMLFFTLVPSGRDVWNSYQYTMHKVDDATLYQTRKKVEDSCRAMISSYTSDSMTYKQYKDSTDSEKQGWAEQAKMRANKTAATYNEYVLKNSYVWEGNVPSDIRKQLDYIK